MATCMVTGGAGFLGSHLCDELLARGHRVICVDNLETGSLENIAHIRDKSFVAVNADITETYYVEACQRHHRGRKRSKRRTSRAHARPRMIPPPAPWPR